MTKGEIKGIHWTWSALLLVAAIGGAFAFQNCGQPLQNDQASDLSRKSRFDALFQGGIPSILIEKDGSGQVFSLIPSGTLNCGALCTGSFPKDTEITLGTWPAAGQVFSGWTVDGSNTVCPGTFTCKVKLSDGQTKVIAKFIAAPPAASPAPGASPAPSMTPLPSSYAQFPKLMVEKSGSGTVTSINPVGTVNCGMICQGNYPPGTRLTLAATPASNSEFVGWTVNNNITTCLGTDTCSITLDSDMTVRARFQPKPDTGVSPAPGPMKRIEIRKTGNGQVVSLAPLGTVNCGIICTGYYPTGTEFALAPMAASGSRFVGWKVNGSSTICQGTLTCVFNLTGDSVVEAEFQSTVQGETSPTRPPTFSDAGGGCNGCDCAWITGTNFPLLGDLELKIVAGNDAWDPSTAIDVPSSVIRDGTTALSLLIPATKPAGHDKTWQEIFATDGLRFTVNNKSIANGWNTTSVYKCAP